MLKLAACGDDCNFCPRYLATRADDVERLKEAAELWLRLGLRDALPSADDMVCHGCSTVAYCSNGIRECAQARGVDNCGQCERYPCQTVEVAFQKAAECAKHAKQVCSKEEYEMLDRAFFSKRQNLEKTK